MKTFVPFLIFILLGQLSFAQSESECLEKLDRALANREKYLAVKQNKIDSIKSRLKNAVRTEDKLDLYDKLYEEYVTLSYDSAMKYVDKAELLAEGIDNYPLHAKVKVQKAMSYATSGHFSQAVDELSKIDSSRLSDEMKEKYYAACQWTYGVWAEYSQDQTFAPVYTRKSRSYLDSLISVTPKGTPTWQYRLAEQALMFDHDFETAKTNYLRALDGLPQNTRLYAQAAFALAQTYNLLNDKANYRKWLINAAISDQMIPVKENLALQDVALLIKNTEADLERANLYLNYSLEDALEYNNRLRILEIGKKLPEIATAYQETILAKNKQLHGYIGLIAVIALILITAIVIIVVQKRKIRQRNETLSSLNEKLKIFNAQLQETNRSREQYVNLFLNLCAAYIEKFNRFQLTTVSKLKAGLYDELLRLVKVNSRPSETEMKELFFNFDTAFLRIYPDFIKAINALLQPDKALKPKNGDLLNTDLRIFALIRIGVTDSTKIATLLFYSPQTIFNKRTQVRNRAINRETFEKDLMEICPICPEQ